MNISIKDLADAIRNNNYGSLIFYQDDEFMSFTNLRDLIHNFATMKNSSFLIDVKDRGFQEWQIVKSKSGNGFRLYCRTLDRIVCRDGVFEMPGDRMDEDTPDVRFLEIEPGYIIRSHEDFLLDRNCKVSFVLHEDLDSILPILWRVYGLDPNLIDDLMEENPYIDDRWDCSLLIGCHTKADALQNLYPEAKLFDEINDMEFESGCLFADGQQYITAEDLDCYIETVRQSLLTVKRRFCFMKNYLYCVAVFLAKAFIEKNGEVKFPNDTQTYVSCFYKLMNPNSTIPFGASYEEITI